MSITTEAWVLYEGEGGLVKEEFSFSAPAAKEVLVEPVFGCWEGNMGHALERKPVDICKLRQEKKVVIGNAGVVRVISKGKEVSKDIIEGKNYIVFGVAPQRHRFGHMLWAHAYDAPQSIGLLAKKSKLHESQLIPMPAQFKPEQWAAFSLRYFTAWANWKVAHGSFRLMLAEQELPEPFVFGWGGGVTLAELELTRHFNYRAAMFASMDARLDLIKSKDITALDRREVPDLFFDLKKYKTDPEYKEAYIKSEKKFLQMVKEVSKGLGASIFVDLIGEPVLRATLKALACPGVLTTAGWKEGMNTSLVRALECMNWHTHVHTHGARYQDALEAIDFALAHHWIPEIDDHIYQWDEIPVLAEAFINNKLATYFPVFQINNL